MQKVAKCDLVNCFVNSTDKAYKNKKWNIETHNKKIGRMITSVTERSRIQ